MKELDIHNKYIESMIIVEDDLIIRLSQDIYFRPMTNCLATNARAMDHNMRDELREFHYDSNSAELKVTLKGDKISQAIGILTYGAYFNETEKDTILRHLRSHKSSNADIEHFDPSVDEQLDENTPLLKKPNL
jgi:hypothetical protein